MVGALCQPYLKIKIKIFLVESDVLVLDLRIENRTGVYQFSILIPRPY